LIYAHANNVTDLYKLLTTKKIRWGFPKLHLLEFKDLKWIPKVIH
jgi:hypothetical protein